MLTKDEKWSELVKRISSIFEQSSHDVYVSWWLFVERKVEICKNQKNDNIKGDDKVWNKSSWKLERICKITLPR